MALLTVILYIIFIILLIIAVLFLFLLLIPIRYKLDGGYDDIFSANFHMYCSPLLAFRGNWVSIPAKPLGIKLIIAGLSFSLHPEKWNKEKKKVKEKEKKQSKNLSFFALLRCLERDLIGSVKVLLVDLLAMLKPKKVEIKGKLGFAEPHLNGWLAAVICMLERGPMSIKLDVEPVWQEEHYEFTFAVEGRVVACVMLFRMARFILARRTLKFLKMLKKERASCAA